jgi:hypothetical protein
LRVGSRRGSRRRPPSRPATRRKPRAQPWPNGQSSATSKGYVLDGIEYDKSVCAGYDWEYPIAGGTIVGRDVYKNDDPAIPSQVTRLAAAVKDQGVDNVMLCISCPAVGCDAPVRAAGIDMPILAATGMDGLLGQFGLGLKDFTFRTKRSSATRTPKSMS